MILILWVWQLTAWGKLSWSLGKGELKMLLVSSSWVEWIKKKVFEAKFPSQKMKSLHVIQCWFYLRDKEPWTDFRCSWIHTLAPCESSWVIHGTLALFRNDNFTIPPCTVLVWCLIQFKPAPYTILVDKDETEARTLPCSPLSHIFGDAAVGQVRRKAM